LDERASQREPGCEMGEPDVELFSGPVAQRAIRDLEQSVVVTRSEIDGVRERERGREHQERHDDERGAYVHGDDLPEVGDGASTTGRTTSRKSTEADRLSTGRKRARPAPLGHRPLCGRSRAQPPWLSEHQHLLRGAEAARLQSIEVNTGGEPSNRGPDASVAPARTAPSTCRDPVRGEPVWPRVGPAGCIRTA
jgi:hypothetical protein